MAEIMEGLADVEDFALIERFLPAGWEAQARELGAIRRSRKFKTPRELLRGLLVHLAGGLSLRAAVVRLEHSELAAVSDVALLKRLRGAEEWLRWMAEGVMHSWAGVNPESFVALPEVRVLDATRVKEPGPRGSHWRLFYSIRLPSLRCDELHISPLKDGESFHRFSIKPGTLAIADRGYAHPKGIASVLEAGADVLVRINLTNVPLLDGEGAPLQIIEHLRPLKTGELADMPVGLSTGESVHPMRLCALRISATAADKAARRAKREASSKKRKVRPETLEAAHFVILLTSLPVATVSAKRVLALYQARWQIELAFKRLKSLLGLGHLKKTGPASARAWLHGKLLVAMLIQALQTAARSFSPWGYPLAPDRPPALRMARMPTDP